MAHYDKIVERPGGGNPAQVEINPLNGVSVPYSSKSFVNDADATLPGTSDVGVSRPDFNADTFANFGEFNFTAAGESPIDWEHIDRKQAGCSVIDMNSIPDESGRTFHGYKEGKYFLPNDAVSPLPPIEPHKLLTFGRQSKTGWIYSMRR